MGRWKIVQPLASRNYVLNPSAETTGNFAGINGAETITRDASGAFGEYCYKIVPGAVDRGIKLNVSTPVAGMKQVFFVAKSVTGSLKAMNGANGETATAITTLGGGWTLYQATAAATFDGATTISISNTKNETWYVDGVVFCTGSRLQTYLDGDQPGCRWTGARHASASVRDGSTRAGGAVYDLEDDLYFRVIRPYGAMGDPENILTQRVVSAGGSVEMSRIGVRTMVLAGWLLASTLATMNAAYMTLADALKPDAVPLAADGRPQPVLLQYYGASRVLQIPAVYAGGMADYGDPEHGFNMQLGLRFDVAAPFWSDVVETAMTLTSETSVTANFILGRVDGEWSELGPPTPAPDAITNFVTALAENARYLYVGGKFEDLAGAGYDHLIRYDKEAGTWDTPWTTAPNGGIRDMLFMPDGDLVVIGEFTAIDGVGADYAATYDGTTWTELGGGLATNDAERIVLDDAGVLWTLDSLQLKKLEPGGAWTNVGAALTGAQQRAVAITPFNTDGARVIAYAYVGGPDAGFMTGSIAHLARIQVYGPDADAGTAAWESGGDPGAGAVYLAFMDRDTLYVAAEYNDTPLQIVTGAAGTVTPVVLSTPSPPITGTAYVVQTDPRTGWVYVGGSFVSDTDVQMMGWRYRNSVWHRLPVTPPDPPVGDDLECRILIVGIDPYYSMPVIPLPGSNASQGAIDNRNLYFGFNTKGTAIVPGGIAALTATATGGAATRPIITLTRSGGVTATLLNIRNRTTGDEIVLNVPLLDGETITIDLVNLRITSSYFGQTRTITPQPGSRMVSFSLLPTGNQIEVRVQNDGATLAGVLRYRQQYHSFAAAD